MRIQVHITGETRRWADFAAKFEMKSDVVQIGFPGTVSVFVSQTQEPILLLEDTPLLWFAVHLRDCIREVVGGAREAAFADFDGAYQFYLRLRPGGMVAIGEADSGFEHVLLLDDFRQVFSLMRAELIPLLINEFPDIDRMNGFQALVEDLATD